MSIICKVINGCKSYGKKTLFQNLNLSIQEGSFCSIVGNSGSGKTTLLNILGTLDTFDSGTLELFSVPCHAKRKRDARVLRRDWISFLFQNFGLVENETILWNLTRAAGIAKTADVLERIEKIFGELGLDMDVKQRVYRLSGGEQQRVALARVMLRDSKLILCDEPTASLDAENSDRVISTLQKLNHNGSTIVLVTHDKKLAACANEHFYLDEPFRSIGV